MSEKQSGAPVVSCDVINCQYNQDRECRAQGIEVTTDHPWPTATSSVGTACDTFKPKDDSVYFPDTV